MMGAERAAGCGMPLIMTVTLKVNYNVEKVKAENDALYTANSRAVQATLAGR